MSDQSVLPLGASIVAKSRQAALSALRARPEECLLAGDAPADREAARRAGVKMGAVRYGYGDLRELAWFDPDYWIDGLRDLLA